MGDISDYYMFQEIGDDIDSTPTKIFPKVWKTKDGKKIHITDMTDEHLINSMNMLNRGAPQNEIWFDVLKSEAMRRKIKSPIKSDLFKCDATEIDLY